MSSNSFLKASNFFLCAFVFVYCLVRSVTVPIFHDEAVTACYLAPDTFSNIFSYNVFFHTNNHWLNTLLIKILVSIFGLSELVIRVPALAGLVIYLWAALRLSTWLLPVQWQWAGLSVLLFNPFVLDFFSAARGYGLGTGLITAALFILIQEISQKLERVDPVKICVAFVLLSFSVAANFTFFHVYVVSLIVMSVALILKKGQSPASVRGKIKGLFMAMLPGVLVLALSIRPMIFVSTILRDKTMYSGGECGFWSSTVKSLVEAVLYGVPYALNMQGALEVFIFMVVIASFGVIVYYLISKKPWPGSLISLSMVLSVVAGVAAIMVVQWNMMGVKYVTGRHAIYLIPLFLIMAVSLSAIGLSVRSKTARAISGIFLLVLAFFSAGHFFKTMNTSSFFIIPQKESVKQAIDHIALVQHAKHLPDDTISLCSSRLFIPHVRFYKMKYGLNWLKELDYEQGCELDGDYDYYYLFKAGDMERLNDKSVINSLAPYKRLKIVLNFSETDSYLAEY